MALYLEADNLGGKPFNIGKRIVKIIRLNGSFGRDQFHSERKGGWELEAFVWKIFSQYRTELFKNLFSVINDKKQKSWRCLAERELGQ